jgi:NTE family protein
MVAAKMSPLRFPFSYAHRAPPAISLALQGGGAHGAFTWGVLDALIERGIEVAALSGASAGAMNAVVLAQGWMHGGGDGARAALHAFWHAVAARVPPLWHVPGDPPRLAPLGHALLAWTRWLTPTQLNPLDLNPLRDVLTAQVDFERLRGTRGIALFIAATEVARGRLRLLRRADITLDGVLASACLPTVSHPVLLDDRAHWDGAFTANPALLPLVREVGADDLLLVTLSPLGEAAPPTTAQAIAERVAEIAFVAPFLREARTLAELQADAMQRSWPRCGLDRRLARLRWHLIDGDDTLASMPGATRLLLDWTFLQGLRDAGRLRVAQWWDASASALGRHSSVDALALFGEGAVGFSARRRARTA